MKTYLRKEKSVPHLLLIVLVLLAAGIATAGTFAYRHYEKQYRVLAEHELSAIAQLKVDELARYRGERLEEAATFQKNVTLSALVRRFLEKPKDVDTQGQLRDWLGKYGAIHDYDQVRLLDTQGVTRLSVFAAQSPVSSAILHSIPKVLQAGEVAFADFYRDDYDQSIYLAILVPIFDEPDGRRPLGVLVLRINPRTFLALSGFPHSNL